MFLSTQGSKCQTINNPWVKSERNPAKVWPECKRGGWGAAGLEREGRERISPALAKICPSASNQQQINRREMWETSIAVKKKNLRIIWRIWRLVFFFNEWNDLHAFFHVFFPKGNSFPVRCGRRKRSKNRSLFFCMTCKERGGRAKRKWEQT